MSACGDGSALFLFYFFLFLQGDLAQGLVGAATRDKSPSAAAIQSCNNNHSSVREADGATLKPSKECRLQETSAEYNPGEARNTV